MQISEIITQLHSRGVTFTLLADNKLKVAGVTRLTDAEKAKLKHHKPALVRYLSKMNRVSLQKIGTCGTVSTVPITRADIEQHSPSILTLADGRKVALAAVLDQALRADADPLGLGDWADLQSAQTLLAFADALLADGLLLCGTEPTDNRPALVSSCNGYIPDAPLADLPLLADDHRFIAQQLHLVPRQQHAAVQAEYRRVWLQAANAEPDENRKDNRGRRAANLHLLRSSYR